jgi:transposase
MGFVQGEGRTQGTLFPVTLEELIPEDHVCRVIDALVDRLDMAGWGFERAEAAETGRPGYDPRDLLKLYLYGYLQQIRSSRRLESECRRNMELLWLLGRLAPEHKTIAEFRRMHREGVTAAGAELVRLARSVGLVKGEWVAIDGSKFQAVSSVKSVHEREALERVGIFILCLGRERSDANRGPGSESCNATCRTEYNAAERELRKLHVAAKLPCRAAFSAASQAFSWRTPSNRKS